MPFDGDSKTTRMMYIFFWGGGCVYIRRGVMRKYACVQEGGQHRGNCAYVLYEWPLMQFLGKVVELFSIRLF